MKFDPEIKLSAALELYGGNQAGLASALQIGRSSVCEWVRSGREFVPELQGHRLVRLHPDIFGPPVKKAS